MTNELKIKRLLKLNGTFLNAILIERIEKIMEMTIEDMEKHPENWKNSVIHNSVIHQLDKNVKLIFKSN